MRIVRMLVVRVASVVLRKQVFAPIVGEVAPHAMYVVGVVLRIVVLDQEGLTLHTIIMTFALLETSYPCKLDGVQSGIANLLQACLRQRTRLRVQVLLD